MDAAVTVIASNILRRIPPMPFILKSRIGVAVVVLLAAAFFTPMAAAIDLGSKDDDPEPPIPEIQMTVWTPVGNCASLRSVSDWHGVNRADFIERRANARPARGASISAYTRRGMRVPIVLEIHNNWGRGYTRRGEVPRDITFSVQMRLNPQQPETDSGLEPIFKTDYYRTFTVPAQSDRRFWFSVQMPRSDYPGNTLELKVSQGVELGAATYPIQIMDMDKETDTPFNAPALGGSRTLRVSNDLIMYLLESDAGGYSAVKSAIIHQREKRLTFPKPSDDAESENIPPRSFRGVRECMLRGDEVAVLPPNWADLEAVDMIVIVGVPSPLTGKRGAELLRALDDWVIAGGSLVWFPGIDVAGMQSAGLPAMFGIKPPSLTVLADQSQATEPSAAVFTRRAVELPDVLPLKTCIALEPDANNPYAVTRFVRAYDPAVGSSRQAARVALCVTTPAGLGKKTVFCASIGPLRRTGRPSIGRSPFVSESIDAVLTALLDARHDARLMYPSVRSVRDRGALNRESRFIKKKDVFGETDAVTAVIEDWSETDYSESNTEWTPWWEAALMRERFLHSLKSDSPVIIPSSERAAQFMLIYLLIVVPVNFLLFSMLKRREWAWFAVPLIALGFAIAANDIAYQGRTGQLTVNQISYVELGADSGYGRADVFIGLYSPSEKTYDVRIDNLAADGEDVASDAGGTSDSNTVLCDTLDGMTNHLVVPITDRASAPPPIEIDQTHRNDGTDRYELVKGIRILNRDLTCLENQSLVRVGDGIRVTTFRSRDDALDYDLLNATGRTLLFPVIVYHHPRTGKWCVKRIWNAGDVNGAWESDQRQSGAARWMSAAKVVPIDIPLMFGNMPAMDKKGHRKAFPGLKDTSYYTSGAAFDQPEPFRFDRDGNLLADKLDDSTEKAWRESVNAVRNALRPDLAVDVTNVSQVRLQRGDLIRSGLMLRWLFARHADTFRRNRGDSGGVMARGYLSGPILMAWTKTAAVPLEINGERAKNYNGMTLIIVHLTDETFSDDAPSVITTRNMSVEPGMRRE